MTFIDPTVLILLAIAGIGYFARNHAVTLAMAVLIVMRLTPLSAGFPWVQKHGVNISIMLLMVAVMVPIANGQIQPMAMLRSFTQWQSLLGIGVGIVVAWLGGRGVPLMSSQPGVVPGLMIGTVLGVAFFRGVPVGPLIAAGLLSLILTAKP